MIPFQLPFRDSAIKPVLTSEPDSMLSTPFSGFERYLAASAMAIEPFNSLFGILEPAHAVPDPRAPGFQLPFRDSYFLPAFVSVKGTFNSLFGIHCLAWRENGPLR